MIDCNITKNYFSEKARMSKTTKSETCRFEKNGYNLARKQAVKAWNRRDDN